MKALYLILFLVSSGMLYSQENHKSGARLYVDLSAAAGIKGAAVKTSYALSKRVVQRDLQLSAAQLKSVNDVENSPMPAESSAGTKSKVKKRARETSGADEDGEQQYADFLVAAYNKLLTADQSKRLQEIIWQIDGLKSLRTDRNLRRSLALSDEEYQKIEKVLRFYDPKLEPLYKLLTAQMLTSFGPNQTLNEINRNLESWAKSITALEKQRDADLYGALTNEQRQKWVELLGKPIRVRWDVSIVNP